MMKLTSHFDRSCASGVTLLLLLSWTLFCGSARATEPPRLVFLDFQQQYLAAQQNPRPLPITPVYVKQDTWHESMRASLEATFGASAEQDSARSREGFRRAVVRLAADAPPIRLTFHVAGLERLFFATLGRYPDHGSAHFLRPRLFDKQGHCTELELDGTVVAHVVEAGQAAASECQVADQTLRGFALSLGEIRFQLDGRYERLEVDVCYQSQMELPPYAAVDCQPVFASATECRQTQEALWKRVAQNFRDRQSQIEMEMERRDGIWNEYAPTGNGPGSAYYLAATRERLALAHKTLELVERTVPRPELAAELIAFEQRLGAQTENISTEDARDLFAQIVDLRRRIVFSHPALDFDRLLLSKRFPPLNSAPGDNYYGINNNTSPGLVVLDHWKNDRPAESALLEGQLAPGCAMQADVSFDGQRIVFAYADHTPPRVQWQFFLYEIRADGTDLRQITGTHSDPLAGADGRMTVLPEDYDPCYLPDGGIAFISTRNQGGVRCHNGDRYCPTYLLYRCDADGSHIRQLSFGEANEWDPMVMPDGQILWTRWDYINRPVIPTLGLWTIRPDGTAAEHYFGNYTPNPCRICEARPIPGTRKIVATTAGHHTMHAGSLILIDRRIAADGMDAIGRLTPEATFPESEPYSQVSFASPYPLNEDLFLAAFSPHPFPASMAHIPRDNAFGIYLVDSLGGRELIYRDPDISCFEPMPLMPRPEPPMLPSQITDQRTPATGVFYLQDVYQSTQGIPRGTIRRLRVNQLIPQPTQRVPYSSAVTFDVLKRVLGTVPVDENGSVAFEAPAGVPLQFQALDENGMAVMTMRTFTHLQPGERAGCVGCHEPRNLSPPTSPTPPAAQVVLQLEPPAGPRYTGGLSFAKTVQPVLDRYCIDCHGLHETAGEISLLGTIEATEETVATAHSQLLPSTAYAALAQDGRFVKLAQYGAETWYSEPKDYFAHGGTLAQLVRESHEGVELDAESLQRLIDWLDLNAPLYGSYSWNKDEWRRPDPQGERALRAHVRERFGEALAGQPFAALVNVALPDESRILKAPLARAAGGWGQIAVDDGGWLSTDESEYRKMRRLVQTAIEPLSHHDIAGTCGHDETCLCLSCWVRQVQEERQRRITAAR
ncbi:MAG: HzsA-related protein [Pirellulaceae bacterium]